MKNLNLSYPALAFITQSIAGLILTLYLSSVSLESLGIFNQFYAFYIVLSLLASFSIQDSVLQKIASNKNSASEILSSGLSSVLLTSCSVSVLSLFLVQIFLYKFISESIIEGFFYIAGALIFSGLNKVYAGFYLGLDNKKKYSVQLMIRAILTVAVSILINHLEFSKHLFAASFLIAELAVFIYLFLNSRSLITKITPSFNHLEFGSKALANSMLSETFIRIDILVMAFFLSDTDIGIYSFIAFFIEGILQIGAMLRQFSNPMLANIQIDFKAKVIILKKYLLISFLATASALSFVYLILPLLTPHLEISRNLLIILGIGLAIYSMIMPIEQFWLMNNRPHIQSYYMAGVCSINIILNVILIPQFGLIGGALGTTVSLLVGFGIVFLNTFKTYNKFLK